ncbi:MAG: hypothetical protein HYS59_02635 [Candidatus Vogelbacteria bacterium]|nr:hypothetical protein [Candidatus Vogelbacteria bacterium]
MRNNTDSELLSLGMLWSAGAVCILLISLYIYFVSNTSLAVIERSRANKESAGLVARIAELDAQYSFRARELTLDSATSRGLYEVRRQNFVTRGARSLGLSFADHGI